MHNFTANSLLFCANIAQMPLNVLRRASSPELFQSSTYKNHLKFGYGAEFQAHRSVSYFNVEAGLADIPQSFKQECLRAARLICEAAGVRKVIIPMSGGLDSEVVARSFLECQIPFEAAILRYLPDLNDFDIRSARAFCAQYNIPSHVIDVDVLEYFKSPAHAESAEKYLCNSPMYSVHLELCRKFKDDFVVFAGVIPTLDLPAEINNNFLHISRYNIIEKTIHAFALMEYPIEANFCFDHFFSKNESQGVSNFFLYTPELILSSLVGNDIFLMYEELQHFSRKINVHDYDLVAHYHTQRISGALKYRFLKRMGFDVEPRESKFTGFEGIHDLFADRNPELKKYVSAITGMTRFNEIYRKPMEERLPRLKLGRFQISETNKVWLMSSAIEKWVQHNISVI